MTTDPQAPATQDEPIDRAATANHDSACCSPQEKSACCAPAQKSACCSPAATEGGHCGCR